MASPVVEAFSLTHAQILNGTTTDFYTASQAFATTSQDEDIYGVNDSSISPNSDQYDNEGDDTVESTWAWLNFAEVNVQAGYVSLPLIASLTGQTVSSSGAGAAQLFAVDLWHEDSFNVSPKPMLVRMPSKDKDGVVRALTIGLYKVQFQPITFDGPKYKDGLKINYVGRALMSAKDEKGTTFADNKKRVGRIISHATTA